MFFSRKMSFGIRRVGRGWVAGGAKNILIVKMHCSRNCNRKNALFAQDIVVYLKSPRRRRQKKLIVKRFEHILVYLKSPRRRREKKLIIRVRGGARTAYFFPGRDVPGA